MVAADPPRQVAPRAELFEPSTEQWRPHRWTAELGPALVVALRRLLGSDPGDRPAHRYGVAWQGHFTPSGDAAGLSDFTAFRRGTYPALARFSNLFRRHGARDIKGMAVKLSPPDGEVTDLVAMSLEVFPVRRSTHFLSLLEALRKGPVRSVAALATMVASRRLSPHALALGVRTAATSRDARYTTFHGVHTFWLVRRSPGDVQTERRPVRYRWVPDVPEGAGPVVGSSETDEIRFTLELQLGNPAWPRVSDPTWRWPRRTPTVRAGRLILDQVLQPEPADLAFNPAVLAPGIEPGDDDVFSDRAGAYAVSQTWRLGHGDRR